tara:strand:+ start:1142 stop:1606 length:465 start_codon:yes stop_codon:yes gene_type:complete
MKKSFLFLLVYFFVLSSCGFKIANFQQNFSINEINSIGDTRINYKIKNKLLSNNNSKAQYLIIINIDTKKDKTVKEKNISNEVTKYELTITSKVNYETLNGNLKGNFSLIKKGDYDVSAKYSDTLVKEKTLLKSLINDLSDEIQETINNIFNDS